jgi:hypothetical protein
MLWRSLKYKVQHKINARKISYYITAYKEGAAYKEG